jgi:predicted membrane protein (TIGR00267 family)
VRIGEELRTLLQISRSEKIARRYLVTNGFDGVLALLGLLVGFRAASNVDLEVALVACLGTAVALGISGISSTYISEHAERRSELSDLRDAMLSDLDGSEQSRAARWAPVFISLVSGLAPFLLAQLVMFPLWLKSFDVTLPVDAYEAAIGIAFLLIFFLGVFLGRIGGQFWLWSGLRTVLIGMLTAAIILMVAP